MPYCGTTWVAPGTTTCPNGDKPTDRPAGAAAPEQAQAQQSTLTATYGWNQDTTPVILGQTKKQSGGYSGIPSGTYGVPNMSTVTDAQNYFNQVWGAGTSATASKADKNALNNLISGLRLYTGSELGTRGSVESAWNDALKDASRSGVDVFSLLGTKNPADTDDDSAGSGPSGGRGYSGPVSTVTNYNEADLRIMADSIGSEVLGRGVTDKEFRKVLAKVRAAESANPSVSGGAAAASMTNVSGLSQQGREDVMTRALLKQNGAEEFTLATKMMGLFNQALEGRPDA